MKKLLLPLLLLGQLTNAKAQSTINANNFNPVVGDVFNGYTLDDSLANSGSTGANQTWDYQSLPTGQLTYNVTYADPAGGAAANNYGSANLRVNSGGSDDRYYQASAFGLQYLGLGSAGGNGLRISNPHFMYKYPLTAGTSYTEIKAEKETDIISGFNDSLVGTSTINVVGYGTLKLPAGTFANVLKVVRTEMDTVYYRGALSSTAKKVSVEWLYPGIHIPLLASVVKTSRQGTDPARTIATHEYSTKKPLQLNELLKKQYGFAVYPNPATNSLNVKLYLNADAEVTVNILSVAGALMSTESRNEGGGKNVILPVNIAALAPGIYVADATVAGVHLYQQFVKK